MSSLDSVPRPEPDEDFEWEEFGVAGTQVIRGCKHECEPVEVEYFPGRMTIVAWICTRCWRTFR